MMQLRRDDPAGDWTVPGVYDVRCLAVTETMAHLDVMLLTGRLSRSGVDGVAHYTRA